MKLIVLKNIMYFDKVVCSEHFLWWWPSEPDHKDWDDLSEFDQTKFIKDKLAWDLNLKVTSWEKIILSKEDVEQFVSERLAQIKNGNY